MLSLHSGVPSFLGAVVVDHPELVQTPFAFLGIPFGPPYHPDDLVVAAGAADAVRRWVAEQDYLGTAAHHDFDWGGALFADGQCPVTDLGDVVGDRGKPSQILIDAREVLGPLVREGRIPLVLGGLDAIPPMVVGPFDGVEKLNVLHIDAHLDFREEVGGERDGYSSPIRRIREMSHVDRIVQVGLRSTGSARPSDVVEARAAGNILVTAWELHEHGLGSVLRYLEHPGRWVVTIDCDGLDPTIAPAVGWPEPGGLTFPQAAGLVRHLARRRAVAALVVTEFQPDLDPHGMTAMTVSRLLLNVVGLQR